MWTICRAAQHFLAAMKMALLCVGPSPQQQPPRTMWQRLQCAWVSSALLEFVSHRLLCTWNGGPAHRGEASSTAGGPGDGAMPIPARGDGSMVLSSYHTLHTRLTLQALLAAAQRQEQAAKLPATTASYALYFSYARFVSQLLCCCTSVLNMR